VVLKTCKSLKFLDFHDQDIFSHHENGYEEVREETTLVDFGADGEHNTENYIIQLDMRMWIRFV
jgi:hypothetical protein